ncbi:MAG TPA: riboflavin synthase [Gemmatimonadaceae bacterium]|nr:riboflavin synthase [Gemmatimonadaceae bacterium]
MFTGIVDDIGTIEAARDTDAGREFRVRCRYTDLAPGESVALSGACLTVRDTAPGWFTVAAVSTTLERTTMGTWAPGTRVNLERSLRPTDRLGGHLVQGHVDGVGRVRRVGREETALVIDVAVPPAVSTLLVPQGSITLDGVSLTVNALPAAGEVRVSIIEYTERHTTLGRLAPGDAVHVEGDVIGKYVRALAAPWLPAPSDALGGAGPAGAGS